MTVNKGAFLTTYKKDVLEKWESEFSILYNSVQSQNFNKANLEQITKLDQNMESCATTGDNSNIVLNQVNKANTKILLGLTKFPMKSYNTLIVSGLCIIY